MIETVDAQLYQWLKTEKAGNYSYVDNIQEDNGITYINFQDGSRVNADLVGEYVIEVESEEDGYEIKEEIIHDMTTAKTQDGKTMEIPGIMHGQKKVQIIPKRKNNTQKRNTAVTKPVTRPEPPKVEIDPVINLLEKAKKEKHTYDVELSVDAISKDLYAVVKNTFEDGEEKSLDYIVSLIDIDKLKDQLKDKLKKVYNDNGEGNTISE